MKRLTMIVLSKMIFVEKNYKILESVKTIFFNILF